MAEPPEVVATAPEMGEQVALEKQDEDSTVEILKIVGRTHEGGEGQTEAVGEGPTAAAVDARQAVEAGGLRAAEATEQEWNMMLRWKTMREELKKHLKKGEPWKEKGADQKKQEMGLAGLECQKSGHSCH